MKTVVVTSLPKTGTSSLAVMLRILGYSVTGPDPIDRIESARQRHNGFQDFPWCFEYHRFNPENTKFIFIIRDNERWVNSFMSTYGKNGDHPCEYYWSNLKNIPENREKLIQEKERHSSEFGAWIDNQGVDCYSIKLEELNWEGLCAFLDLKVPRNIFGQVLPVPKVNSASSRKFIRSKKTIKRAVSKIIPRHRLVSLRNMIFRVTGVRI